MFPLAFGCIDNGLREAGISFGLPGFVHYVVNYWFARKRESVWRFNPCDIWESEGFIFLAKGGGRKVRMMKVEAVQESWGNWNMRYRTLETVGNTKIFKGGL
jgi:hypothetical protein